MSNNSNPGIEHLIEVALAALVSIVGTLGAKTGLEKTAKRKLVPIDEGTKQLIIELRKQLAEVKRDLTKERNERERDNRKHRLELQSVRDDLAEARTNIAILTKDAALHATAETEGDT